MKPGTQAGERVKTRFEEIRLPRQPEQAWNRKYVIYVTTRLICWLSHTESLTIDRAVCRSCISFIPDCSTLPHCTRFVFSNLLPTSVYRSRLCTSQSAAYRDSPSRPQPRDVPAVPRRALLQRDADGGPIARVASRQPLRTTPMDRPSRSLDRFVLEYTPRTLHMQRKRITVLYIPVLVIRAESDGNPPDVGAACGSSKRESRVSKET